MFLDVFNSEKLLRGLCLACPEESFTWVTKTQRQPTLTSTVNLLCKDELSISWSCWLLRFLYLAPQDLSP